MTIGSRKLVMVIDANMVELVKSPSTWVLSKGRLALWLVVSLVFATLLFAVSAQAQGMNAPDGAAETPIGEAATKSGAPPGEAPAVVEQTPPAVEEAPAVVEKKTVEQTAGEVGAEAGSEAPQGPGEASQVLAGASELTHKDATGEVAPEISIAVTTSVAPAAASEISTSPVQDLSPLTLWPQTISVRSAGQMSCVRASITAGYAGGWLDISVASSISNIRFATVDASPTAITAGAPAGSLGSGSAVENHPFAPGSGSGGAGGGSAAGGGSGSASSASSTLVDVLLQAAPRAIRRLRLAQPSWRTSFFVLIPERPG
ncbi:MAG: hypothetical protein WAN93_03635 [Solirubrobacteraceae bacterium]